jgi:asparagine synthase (glutamine-hydrolysing)
MRLAVLFSGGKDSNLALIKAKELGYKVVCLLNLIPLNNYSYMFQSINVELTKLQAEALEIPIIQKITKGEKEKELKDLEKLLREAIKEYKIEGIVIGALKSTYQSLRIQKIANELGLWAFNPLWLMNEEKELEELKKYNFKAIITRVSSYPLTVSLLGKDLLEIKDFLLKNKNLINISGEGGEYETFVLFNKYYKKKIVVEEFEIKKENENLGDFIIKKARLVDFKR